MSRRSDPAAGRQRPRRAGIGALAAVCLLLGAGLAADEPAVCSPDSDRLLRASDLRWVRGLHAEEERLAAKYAGDGVVDALVARPASRRLAEDLAGGRIALGRIVVVQRRPVRCSHVYTYHNEGFQPGGGLWVLTPGADGGRLEKLVDSPGGQILSCDVSWDGREILFSWRRGEDDFYHVYRIAADGTGLTALTSGPSHNFDACWLGEGGVAFISTRVPQVAYCWVSPVGVLHRMDRDGGRVRRLSANYLNDFTPCATEDGRIMYCRWEYVDRPVSVIHGLWTVQPDGSQLRVFYGNRVLNPCTFMEPQSIPGTGRILCTMTSHNGLLGRAVGIIDPIHGNNAQAGIRNLTPEIDIGRVDGMTIGCGPRGPYERPFPVDEELFLVSRNGTVLLRDYDATRCAVVLRPRDGIGFYSPQPLRPRRRPAVIPSDLKDPDGPWATVILQDVYRGLEPGVRRGEVRRICVVQEIPKPQRAAFWKHPEVGTQFPVVSCGATLSPKQVWGFAAVGADGSACFRVPANRPIYFMALDAEGRAVQRMRSFTHLVGGETQACIGCHEPRNQAPPLSPPAGLRSDPQPLEPPPWGLGGFSYARIVQPVLDRHCAACHKAPDPPKGLDLAGDATDLFNVSYEHLAREGGRANRYTRWIPTTDGQELNILRIDPRTWGSPVSRLADTILSGHLDAEGRPRVRMSPPDRQRILTWIDLNVPYYATSQSLNTSLPGCRQVLPARLDEVLADVAARRCASCHVAGDKVRIPRRKWVRLTNPQLNSFLLAPLAKDAGGSGRCGRAVFASTDDPDYRAILRTFDGAGALLTDPPREDIAQEGPPNRATN